MTDQVETKQVQWEDLEVAEEPVVTEWEEGSELVPVEMKYVIRLNTPMSEEELEGFRHRWADRVNEDYRRAILGSFQIPEGEVDSNFGGHQLSTMRSQMGLNCSILQEYIAQCTPGRNPRTGR